LVKLQLNFGHSQSLAGQLGFGLTGTEYLQMTLRLPLKEAESAPVLAELFGFDCSLPVTSKFYLGVFWNRPAPHTTIQQRHAISSTARFNEPWPRF
jgi:hypothetical protein